MMICLINLEDHCSTCSIRLADFYLCTSSILDMVKCPFQRKNVSTILPYFSFSKQLQHKWYNYHKLLLSGSIYVKIFFNLICLRRTHIFSRLVSLIHITYIWGIKDNFLIISVRKLYQKVGYHQINNVLVMYSKT